MTEKRKEPNREFVTSSGKVIHLRPVAKRSLRDAETDVEREFEAREEPIEPPKYEVPLAGGGTKEWYHDEVSIKTATDEEKEAWAKHQECLARLKLEQSERVLAVGIIEGVEEEPTKEWKHYMAWRKATLPKNPYDLKVRYVTYEFLRTQEDIIGFTSAMMLMSAGMEVDEAAIDAAMGYFRDSLRRHSGPAFEKFAEALAGRGEGELDVQSGVPEGAGGGESGQVDDGIRPDEQD